MAVSVEFNEREMGTMKESDEGIQVSEMGCKGALWHDDDDDDDDDDDVG